MRISVNDALPSHACRRFSPPTADASCMAQSALSCEKSDESCRSSAVPVLRPLHLLHDYWIAPPICYLRISTAGIAARGPAAKPHGVALGYRMKRGCLPCSSSTARPSWGRSRRWTMSLRASAARTASSAAPTTLWSPMLQRRTQPGTCCCSANACSVPRRSLQGGGDLSRDCGDAAPVSCGRSHGGSTFNQQVASPFAAQSAAAAADRRSGRDGGGARHRPPAPAPSRGPLSVAASSAGGACHRCTRRTACTMQSAPSPNTHSSVAGLAAFQVWRKSPVPIV